MDNLSPIKHALSYLEIWSFLCLRDIRNSVCSGLNRLDTCHTVVCPRVKINPVLLSQLDCVHLHIENMNDIMIGVNIMTFLVVQDGVAGTLIIGDLRLPEPHVVDVHVGGAHPELADMLVQRVPLKPHGAQEGHLGKLVVEHVLSIDYPDALINKIW